MLTPAQGDFRLPSEADTARLGRAIGLILRPGDMVCLDGPLGAGKSVMARAAILTLCPQEREAPSPTFTLVQFYEGPAFPLAHFDLYRIASPDEAFEIGLDEALLDGAALVEWSSRLGHHLPESRLDVEISLDGEGRRVRLTAHGDWRERGLEF